MIKTNNELDGWLGIHNTLKIALYRVQQKKTQTIFTNHQKKKKKRPKILKFITSL